MKGDYIDATVRTSTGTLTVRVTARKAGRRVQRKAKTWDKTGWVEIMEVTRFGKPCGNTAQVRGSEVLSIEEHLQTDEKPRASRGKPKPKTLPMFAEAEA